MRRARPRGGRAGFGAATVAAAACAAGVVLACAADTPMPTERPSAARPSIAATASLATTTPAPSTPTEFAIHRIQQAFRSVTALTSTGEHLYWGSEAAVWRFTPGATDLQRVYENPADGALIWDVAAAGDSLVFSELLASPAGTGRVAYVPDDGAAAVELDRGVAERGAPPTLAIDDRRLAWAGFDESSGSPRSFLRIAERATPATGTTLLDLDIDDGLLWHPQLDENTLWYGIIEPDFTGTRGGDEIHIETIDLANPSAGPARFDGHANDFNPAVSADHVVWKSVEPGFAALTWGKLHILDRRTSERLVVGDQVNNPTVGPRFVAFEEISHQKLLIYDLATRTLVEIPVPTRGNNGTVGQGAISGNLLGFSVSAKGAKTVSWIILPD
jgi:hypothetical protein